MDTETQSILQSLLDLCKSNSAHLNRLQAENALQKQAINALLFKSPTFSDLPAEFIDSYVRVRSASLDIIELADDRGGFDAMLAVVDQKFLGVLG